MEFVDDDSTSPCLSYAELNELFEELQSVLAEKDEAVEKVDRLQNAKPGDEEYDDIAKTSTSSDVNAYVQGVSVALVRRASHPNHRVLFLA